MTLHFDWRQHIGILTDQIYMSLRQDYYRTTRRAEKYI